MMRTVSLVAIAVIFSIIDQAEGRGNAHVAHIIVATPAEQEQVLVRLRDNNENFAAVAMELSLCPSKHRGGDLGMLHQNELTKEFDVALFPNTREKNDIPAGTLLTITTNWGYHVLKVISHSARFVGTLGNQWDDEPEKWLPKEGEKTVSDETVSSSLQADEELAAAVNDPHQGVNEPNGAPSSPWPTEE